MMMSDMNMEERNEPDTEEGEVDIRGFPIDEHCDTTIGEAAIMIEQ